MIKFFKKEKKFKKDILYLNPNFYWEMAVCFIFLVVVLSSLFGYYIFIQTNQEPALSTSDTSGKVEIVNKRSIEKVLEYFSEREKKSNQILYSPSPVVDPSL